MQEVVSQYNTLVAKWNERFGHLCSAIPVDEDDFRFGVARLQSLTKNEMSERKKITTTITVVGDYAVSIQSVPPKTKENKLSRTELATLIVSNGEKILDSL